MLLLSLDFAPLVLFIANKGRCTNKIQEEAKHMFLFFLKETL